MLVLVHDKQSTRTVIMDHLDFFEPMVHVEINDMPIITRYVQLYMPLDVADDINVDLWDVVQKPIEEWLDVGNFPKALAEHRAMYKAYEGYPPALLYKLYEQEADPFAMVWGA